MYYIKKIFFVKVFMLMIMLTCININIYAQVYGCTDPSANNYSNSATNNDGSCTYNDTTITPSLITKLSTKLNETSGLLFLNKKLYTHNDSGGDPAIYNVNTKSGNIAKTITITNATNVDWEDIAQDTKYIYVGDFGNNANGNRTDLKIYRIKKSDVNKSTSVTAGIINFSYDDQTDFTPAGSNNTNFDCEALIAYGDSLFLFSKDWVDSKTRLYKLPKIPGTYTAVKTGELYVQGLITGAEILEDKKVIVLSGYNNFVSPFIYMLYDFKSNDFFGADKRKVQLDQSFLQFEGIAAITDSTFYISNEKFNKFVTTPAKLQTLNLSFLLNPYYNHSTLPIASKPKKQGAFNAITYNLITAKSKALH